MNQKELLHHILKELFLMDDDDIKLLHDVRIRGLGNLRKLSLEDLQTFLKDGILFVGTYNEFRFFVRYLYVCKPSDSTLGEMTCEEWNAMDHSDIERRYALALARATYNQNGSAGLAPGLKKASYNQNGSAGLASSLKKTFDDVRPALDGTAQRARILPVNQHLNSADIPTDIPTEKSRVPNRNGLKTMNDEPCNDPTHSIVHPNVTMDPQPDKSSAFVSQSHATSPPNGGVESSGGDTRSSNSTTECFQRNVPAKILPEPAGDTSRISIPTPKMVSPNERVDSSGAGSSAHAEIAKPFEKQNTALKKRLPRLNVGNGKDSSPLSLEPSDSIPQRGTAEQTRAKADLTADAHGNSAQTIVRSHPVAQLDPSTQILEQGVAHASTSAHCTNIIGSKEERQLVVRESATKTVPTNDIDKHNTYRTPTNVNNSAETISNVNDHLRVELNDGDDESFPHPNAEITGDPRTQDSMPVEPSLKIASNTSDTSGRDSGSQNPARPTTTTHTPAARTTEMKFDACTKDSNVNHVPVEMDDETIPNVKSDHLRVEFDDGDDDDTFPLPDADITSEPQQDSMPVKPSMTIASNRHATGNNRDSGSQTPASTAAQTSHSTTGMKLDASRDDASVETPLVPVHNVNHVPVEMDDNLGKPVLESVVPTETKENHVDIAAKPKTMNAESHTTTNTLSSSPLNKRSPRPTPRQSNTRITRSLTLRNVNHNVPEPSHCTQHPHQAADDQGKVDNIHDDSCEQEPGTVSSVKKKVATVKKAPKRKKLTTKIQRIAPKKQNRNNKKKIHLTTGAPNVNVTENDKGNVSNKRDSSKTDISAVSVTPKKRVTNTTVTPKSQPFSKDTQTSAHATKRARTPKQSTPKKKPCQNKRVRKTSAMESPQSLEIEDHPKTSTRVPASPDTNVTDADDSIDSLDVEDAIQRLDTAYEVLDDAETVLLQSLQKLQAEETVLRRALQYSTTSIAFRRREEKRKLEKEALERLQRVVMGALEDSDSDSDDGVLVI